jgi:hypothetical protein
MARKPENRELIAKVISPAQYLNQPEAVIAQVLTGKFADGLGKVQNVPGRADFDPMPWQSMAVWMLTQMKRWGYVKGDVNYKQIAEKVFLITDARKHMKELGHSFLPLRLTPSTRSWAKSLTRPSPRNTSRALRSTRWVKAHENHAPQFARGHGLAAHVLGLSGGVATLSHCPNGGWRCQGGHDGRRDRIPKDDGQRPGGGQNHWLPATA